MSFADCMHCQRPPTTILQFLGDIRYIGVFNMVSSSTMAAMRKLVKGDGQYAVTRRVTVRGFLTAAMPSFGATRSVNLAAILQWLVDPEVTLVVEAGSYDDPENLGRYLPANVYPTVHKLIIQSRYIYRFDGLRETFPALQHLVLDIARERESRFNVHDLGALADNWNPIETLCIRAPAAESIQGLRNLGTLASLRVLQLHDMEEIRLADIAWLVTRFPALEALELYSTSLDVDVGDGVFDLSTNQQLVYLGIKNTRLVHITAHPTGFDVRFIPPPNLQKLVCLTTEGLTRTFKKPDATLEDEMLTHGVDIAYYESRESIEDKNRLYLNPWN